MAGAEAGAAALQQAQREVGEVQRELQEVQAACEEVSDIFSRL